MFQRATARRSYFPLLQISVLAVCFPAQGLSQVAVDRWTTDDGLPINTVRAICQTPDGYLWLTTFDGLVRFDGVHFTTYNKSNTEGIGGNRFSDMICTADGDFWAATEGSGITHYRQGRFSTYTVRDGLPSDNVNGVSGDDNGFWVLTRGYVSQWRPAERKFVALPRQEYLYSSGLRQDGRGAFYRVDHTGLRLFLRGVQKHYSLPAGWDGGGTMMAAEDVNGHIWLGASTGKVAELTQDRWSSASGDVKGTRGDPGNSFMPDYRDSHGNIWHTDIEWDPASGLIQYMYLPDGSGPAKIAFSALFEDREGGLWLTTDGNGLYRLRTQAIKVYSKEQGLPDRNVYPICQSRDASIWIGTWSGGLCRLRNGKFTTYSTANGLASNRVSSVFEDRDGTLWVALQYGPPPYGLYRMRHGRFVPVGGASVISSDATVRVMHQDRLGVMWFGTGDGLIRLDKGRWTRVTRKDGLATDDVRAIIDGRNGNLWVGGYGGLSSLYNGQIQAWTDKAGLVSNTIRALYEDADGVLWIGTYDAGLGRFENGRFTKYTVREGLFNSGVFQILEDSRANFWMSSNQGIYRISKKQLNDFAAGKTRAVTSIAYGRRDGMRNVECNGGLMPAGIKAADGKLWFPTQDGVAVIDPENLVSSPLPPPPVSIESCLIDRVPAGIDNTVQVTPGRENFEIHYTALSFIGSERIRFRYILEGLDRDWVEAGTRRTAYYSHVPSGRYVFRVTAAHSDGIWNETAATLSFVVLPPFYRTWWFISLCAALAGASLGLGWRYRLNQLERSQAAQQAFSRQLITSEENLRKRIAAELHDSLGQRLVIIQNLALILLQSVDGGSGLKGAEREKVEEISAEVSGAVGEVQEISYNLRPYRLDRLGLTAALRSMIETASAASSVAFFAEIDDIDGVLPKEAEINFYRIVQECVNNILKHSKAAQASVRVGRTKEGLTLTVRDDGKGFDHGLVQAASFGGFGLIGISERAQLLGGRAAIHSTPGQGTTVTIEINSDSET